MILLGRLQPGEQWTAAARKLRVERVTLPLGFVDLAR